MQVLGALAALVAFHAMRDVRWRQAVLAVASGAFVWSFASNAVALAPLLGWLALGYGLVRFARVRVHGAFFGAAVVAYVLLFAYLRRYTVLAGAPQLPVDWVTVGLSYVLFRVLHLAIDAHQDPARPAEGPGAYLLYTCAFLTFVSGPIQRWEDHRAQLLRLGEFQLDAATARAGFSRVANGYLKVALISAALLKLHAWWVGQLQGPDALPVAVALAGAALTYLLFLYANFSGSIDVVMGLGALFGFALPENFAAPFAAANLIDFWNRWHITLSQWFKFYVFNPLIKLFGPSVWTGAAASFITFLLMGLWHGTTPAYFFYGVALGAGVAANRGYEAVLRARLGKKELAALRSRALYAALANAATIAFVAFALTLWWLPAWPGLLPLGAGFAFATVAVIGCAAIGRVAAAIGPRALAWSETSLAQQLWLGARTFAIACLAFDTSFHVPELVYRGF